MNVAFTFGGHGMGGGDTPASLSDCNLIVCDPNVRYSSQSLLFVTKSSLPCAT